MHGLGLQYILAEQHSDLDGPNTGEVPASVHRDVRGHPITYDLSVPPRVEMLYTTVLGEGRHLNELHHLNWSLLMTVWPDLPVPGRVRDMWESTYPELAGNTGPWGTRRRGQR